MVTHVRFLFDTNPRPVRTSKESNASLARTVETIMHENSQPKSTPIYIIRNLAPKVIIANSFQCHKFKIVIFMSSTDPYIVYSFTLKFFRSSHFNTSQCRK